MKKFFLFLAFLLFFPTAFCQEEVTTSAAFGVKEIKTIDMYFGYHASINKNTWGYAYLNFTPIDGVSNVKVALIRIIEEQTGTTTINIVVNNTPCKTRYITSTIGRAQYVADFDCSNVINGSGYYVVGIYPSGDINNVHFRSWITYENDPEAQLNQTLEYITSNIDEVKMLLFDAYETRKYCVNDTLIIEKVSNITLGNKTYQYLKSESVECRFGCDDERKECNYPNWIYYLIIFGIIVVGFFVVKHIILPLMG